MKQEHDGLAVGDQGTAPESLLADADKRPTSSWTRGQLAVATVFVAARFMTAIDETIVNVALPNIARQFHQQAADLDAVVIIYLIAQAVVIPASGWVGDLWGTKRIFMASLAVFTITSALCGFAANLPQLIVFRLLQGMAAGLLIPVSTTLQYRAFPPEQRSRAAQATIVPAILAPAMGPILGGVLVDHLSWCWVFWVNVPIGLVTLIFALIAIREQRMTSTSQVDWIGLILSVVGLGLLFYGVSKGPTAGWSSLLVLTSLIVGIIALVALVRLQLTRRTPLLDLRLLSERLFCSTNAASLFANASFIGILFIMPIYLQAGRGFSALDSGLATFPEAIGGALFSQVVGRLYGRVGPRRLIAAGSVWLALAALGMTVLDGSSSLWLIRGLMFAAGMGIVWVLVPVQTAAFTRISEKDTSHASTLFNVQLQAAGALGVAVLDTVLLSQPGIDTKHVWGVIEAMPAAFIAAAILGVLAFLASLAIRDADASTTMTASNLQ